jgi:hypothetical protein
MNATSLFASQFVPQTPCRGGSLLAAARGLIGRLSVSSTAGVTGETCAGDERVR